jgi:hypothetical protein
MQTVGVFPGRSLRSGDCYLGQDCWSRDQNGKIAGARFLYALEHMPDEAELAYDRIVQGGVPLNSSSTTLLSQGATPPCRFHHRQLLIHH